MPGNEINLCSGYTSNQNPNLPRKGRTALEGIDTETSCESTLRWCVEFPSYFDLGVEIQADGSVRRNRFTGSSRI